MWCHVGCDALVWGVVFAAVRHMREETTWSVSPRPSDEMGGEVDCMTWRILVAPGLVVVPSDQRYG